MYIYLVKPLKETRYIETSMYQKKIPKSQEPYKTTYVAYVPHSTEALQKRNWPNAIRIISIDPGISNFCIRVEERGFKTYIPIKTLLFEKLHLRKDEQELQEDFICQYYTTLSNFLDKYLDLFKTCHMVIVEKQMPFNYRAVRISQHILTYFQINLKDIVPNVALILELDSKLKGKELGASTHLNSRGLKAWAIDKAKELLTFRKDEHALEILHLNKKKADDLADTVCQIEALFSYHGWLLTQETITLTIPDKPKTIKLVIGN